MIKVYHPTLNITLRELALSNAEELFALINENRDFLSQTLGWLDKTTKLEHAEKFILFCQQGNQNKKALTFGIWKDEQLIGIVGFHEIDTENQTSSMGYWLAAACQGSGIMTASVKALIEYAIQEFNLEKITIRVSVTNMRSQAIPQKLGFTPQGIKEKGEIINGIALDQIIFGITKEEWESLQRSKKYSHI